MDVNLSEELIKASPIARKLAKQKGIDITLISGSGPGKRIIEKDVLEYASRIANEERGSNIIAPRNYRSITAERTAISFKSAPHFYLGFNY